MTFSADKLPPPPKTQDVREWSRWYYRMFELLNGIQTILGSGIEVTAAGVITETTLQGVIGQINTLITALQAVDTAHVAASDPHTGYQKESEKGVASGYASLDAGGTVPDAQIPSGVTRDAEAALIYAPIAKGVTNGDSHDHSGGDGAQIDHAGLANLTTGDPHTQYQEEDEKDAASGYAGLNASSRTTKGVDTTDDLIVDLATKGLVLKDAQGTPHYWRVTVTTLGVLTTADLGTGKP